MSVLGPQVLPVSRASLRERKKRMTRDTLRRCAVNLVAERGLGRVTVEEIAAAAGVSTRTFFNYFSGKEDAVIGWDPSFVAELRDRVRGRPAGESPPAVLRAALLEALAPFDADPRELLERLRVTRSDPHLIACHVRCWSATERELAAALAERRGTDPAHDHYVSLVVAALLSASRVALMSWCDEEGRVTLAEEMARHLDVLAAGLAEPERSAL